MAVPVVELSRVSKNYYGLRPLRVEALSLSPGEHVAILGFDEPMAETFVNLVTGATLPDSGDVRVYGRRTAEITDSTDWLGLVDRFGIVSPRAVLLDGFSVLQNLAMPFTLDVEPPPDDVREKAVSLAHEVGLAASDLERPVASLDELGRARIRLGRALALDPTVLILEHASASLARRDVVGFGVTVRKIGTRRGIAVVAVSADRDFAMATAGRVLTHEGATGRLRAPPGGFFGRIFGS
jgi:ABC-type branched-subunit amino acid transport system ATPase component